MVANSSIVGTRRITKRSGVTNMGIINPCKGRVGIISEGGIIVKGCA